MLLWSYLSVFCELGVEHRGVALEYLKVTDQMVKIPILGEIESLNVSVAASVLIYKAVKQRMV